MALAGAVLVAGCGDSLGDGPLVVDETDALFAEADDPGVAMEQAWDRYEINPSRENLAAFRIAKSAFNQARVAVDAPSPGFAAKIQPNTTLAMANVDEGWRGGSTEWTYQWTGSIRIPDNEIDLAPNPNPDLPSIPQFGLGVGVPQTVPAPTQGTGTLLDVDVEITEIRHTWIQDARIYLRGPVPDTFSVLAFNVPSAWNVQGLIPEEDTLLVDMTLAYFDDEAPKNISWWDDGALPPFDGDIEGERGYWRPYGFYWWGDGIRHPSWAPLDVFDGATMAGQWVLHLYDTAAQDRGTLREWKLILTIEGPPLPPVGVGQPYSARPNGIATDGTYSWSIPPGDLPPGLTFDPGTGFIQGTPTLEGTWAFILTGTSGPTVATTELSLTVNTPLTAVDPSPLAPGVLDAEYPATQLLSTGGGAGETWSSSGLPPGMTLSSDGLLEGTPTQVGAYSFTVTVTTDDGQTSSLTLTLDVVYPSLEITTSGNLYAVAGNPYAETLTAVGGGGGYSWEITDGTLPLGISLQNGLLTGTPQQEETTTFTLQATSLDGSVTTKVITMEITDPNANLAIVTTSLPDGLRGDAYSAALEASGADRNYTWTITLGSLPDGLSLVGDVITGTPTVAGLSTFTVRVEAGYGTPVTAELSIEVFDPALTIDTETIPEGRLVGLEYPATQLTASGGDGINYTWEVAPGSPLPPGLELTSDGILSGTPSGLGSQSVELQVTSGTGNYTQTVSRAFTIYLDWPELAILTTALPGGGTDAPYRTTQLEAEGGDGQYTWSWSPRERPDLPPGLTLSTDGVVSGVPEIPGFYKLTIQAESGVPPFDQTVTKDMFISIAFGDPLGVGDCGDEVDRAYWWVYRFDRLVQCVRFVEEGIDSRDGEFPELKITPFVVPPAPLGSPFAMTFSATGGDDDLESYYTWSSENLLGWLGITYDTLAGTGTVSGTPVIAGAYAFDITVTSHDALITASELVSVPIPWVAGGTPDVCASDVWASHGFDTELQCRRYVASEMDSREGEYPALIVPFVPDQAWVTGSEQSVPFPASGGADGPDSYYLWSSNDLPSWLTLDETTGVVSGTPLTIGSHSFSVSVESWADSEALFQTVQSNVVTITVDWGDPAAAADCLSNGWAIYGFNTEAQCLRFADPTNPYYSMDSREGEYPALTITTESLPSGRPGVEYDALIEATGGMDDPGFGYDWALEGILPEGLSFVDGAISGVPAEGTEGTYEFDVTVSVMDYNVEPPVVMETVNLPFSIIISSDPETMDDCKKGGYLQYGFNTQGNCIQFVNTGFDSRIRTPGTQNNGRGNGRGGL